jgi:hypothetical protein
MVAAGLARSWRGGANVRQPFLDGCEPPRRRNATGKARCFEDQARSCIDPPLSRVLIRPIETDGQGGGVVLFRTSPSRCAPHRLTTTLESFVRRGSSTVKMTMREIQDMTLNVVRGLAGVDASFLQRRDAFKELVNSQTDILTYRVTAIPLIDLPDPGRIFGKPGVFPVLRVFTATVGSRTAEFTDSTGQGFFRTSAPAGSRSKRRIQFSRFSMGAVLERAYGPLDYRPYLEKPWHRPDCSWRPHHIPR